MVQTYSRHVWACPIKNTRFSTLLEAIKQMVKVSPKKIIFLFLLLIIFLNLAKRIQTY